MSNVFNENNFCLDVANDDCHGCVCTHTYDYSTVTTVNQLFDFHYAS